MSINRSIILSGLALAVAVPVALASSGKEAPIVNPALPDSCVPPGLVKGQPRPANWAPPTTWRPAPECLRMPLFVRPPAVEDDDDRPVQTQPQQPQQGQQGQPPRQPQGSDDTRPPKPNAAEQPDRGGDGARTDQGTEQADAPDVRPAFKPSFFRRTWQMKASVFAIDTVDGKLRLDVDVDRLLGVPRGLRAEAKALTEYGAYVLLSPTVKVSIFNPELEERFPATADDIQADDEIRVKGRFLKPSNWLLDDGGDRVATMRATGVVIIDDEYAPEDGDPAQP